MAELMDIYDIHEAMAGKKISEQNINMMRQDMR